MTVKTSWLERLWRQRPTGANAEGRATQSSGVAPQTPQPFSPPPTRSRLGAKVAGAAALLLTLLAVAHVIRPALTTRTPAAEPASGEPLAQAAAVANAATADMPVATAVSPGAAAASLMPRQTPPAAALSDWQVSSPIPKSAALPDGRTDDKLVDAAQGGMIVTLPAPAPAAGAAAAKLANTAVMPTSAVVSGVNATSATATTAATASASGDAVSANTGSSGASSVSGVVALTALPVTTAAVAPAVSTTHPRLLLDSATLTALRANAAANTAEWQQLKAVCDSFIGGTVNYPTQNAYPDLPNLGSGYQGESYLPALLAEGMCYQVLKSSNASAAAPYGAKAVDILVKMSAPFSTGSGNQGVDPCTDSGYGIRFYGVGYGLGYDWVYELLTAAQRSQVYTTANAWLTAWEKPGGCADFEYEHPQSNYFAGYFHAKAVIALGTYGDNPSAPAEWNDWYLNQFGNRVQPYYAQHLLGGGWPEGFGNYAPLGILNMSLPAREVMTATGQDIVHASAAYSYPLDSADYAMQFTWPSLAYFDDRDTNRSSSDAQPPGTSQVGMFQQILGELAYWKSPKAAVMNQYLSLVKAASSNFNPADPWLSFLETTPAAPTASLTTLPLSYLAPGMSAVAARSDWTTGASWMSFRAGPYVNNPAQGEEYFDQGSLAVVRGATPLLLNASGWVVHNPNGTAEETNVYNDNYGSTNGTVYMGNRQIYNIFYVRNMSGNTVVDPYGQAANTTEDNQVRTQVSSYEDGGDYVYLLATHIEDMYRTFAAGPAVVAWAREVVYLRPDRFVVYDRTTEGSTNYDQYMAWHFPASPVAGTTATGQKRLDVTYNGQYAGAMTTVLPLNATLTTIAQYPGSNPVKAWQVQVRPPNKTVTQQWLTVFDTSSSAATVAKALAVTVTQGAVVGVSLTAADGNSVVISSSGAPGVPISGAIAYAVPALAAQHVVTDLVPATGYTITVSTSGSTQTVTVTPGGTRMSSARGVLDFYVSAAGVVQAGKPVISTLPISTMPVNGYPRTYPP